MQRVEVQSLVRELRFHMPRGQKNHTHTHTHKIRSNIVTNVIFDEDF